MEGIKKVNIFVCVFTFIVMRNAGYCLVWHWGKLLLTLRFYPRI